MVFAMLIYTTVVSRAGTCTTPACLLVSPVPHTQLVGNELHVTLRYASGALYAQATHVKMGNPPEWTVLGLNRLYYPNGQRLQESFVDHSRSETRWWFADGTLVGTVRWSAGARSPEITIGEQMLAILAMSPDRRPECRPNEFLRPQGPSASSIYSAKHSWSTTVRSIRLVCVLPDGTHGTSPRFVEYHPNGATAVAVKADGTALAWYADGARAGVGRVDGSGRQIWTQCWAQTGVVEPLTDSGTCAPNVHVIQWGSADE